jgi:aminodeoxyfutalosine synthase
MNSALETVEAKLAAGERLGRDDGIALFASDDLAGLGRLADAARRRRHGDAAWYIVNTHVNHTNVCINECPLCAFWRCDAAPDAYLLSPSEVRDRAAPDVEAGATEIHVVGGLHPDADLDYYLALLGALREAFPEVCLQALTAVEVAHAAAGAGLAVGEVLARLREAGLTGLPGGGAEIFDGAIRGRIAPRKLDADAWLDVHRAAHALGIATNATMLYGHIETCEHRVDHLLALRRLQDESLADSRSVGEKETKFLFSGGTAPAGFQAFIPLPFHPHGTGMADLPGPTAHDALKTMAASRLVLDNVPHVKAFWIMLGEDLAQLALRFGADDVDGTVVREEITHAAGATTPQGLTVERIEHLIRTAGCRPLERDTLYRRIVRDPGGRSWRRIST